MTRASQRFTDDQRTRVGQAVAEAEGRTSAEIVPVVAASSARYDRAEDVVGVFVGVAAMIVAALLLPRASSEPGSWGGMSAGLRLLFLALAVVAGFVAGAVLATSFHGLRALFIPRAQAKEEVNLRARAVFFDKNVRRTAGATGVLIYVSLQERMAAILADDAALERLGQPAVEKLRDEFVKHLRRGDVIDALCKTILAAGEALAPVLPRAADDVNELSDALIVLD